jgi:exonuclease SbcC
MQLLAAPERNELELRAIRLEGLASRLAQLEASVEAGTEVLRLDARAQGTVAAARSADHLLTEARELADELYRTLSRGDAINSRPLSEVFEDLESQISLRIDDLGVRAEARREAVKHYDGLRRAEEHIAKLVTTLREEQEGLQRLESGIVETERRRARAREVLRVAAETRAGIVRQVFNDSLNQVWRDLFIRLAPTEPYVPAFRLPDNPAESVVARLETVHRAGGRGGSPSSMLSAGNLNTAALTLFLALHLSAQPRLPWLLLDDPVQSMDDVHISQFSALLRTLSKKLDRQMVVAVHDRGLFDYLALEMTPAYPGDSLITLELSRSLGGDTVAEPQYYGYREDPALMVA